MFLILLMMMMMIMTTTNTIDNDDNTVSHNMGKETEKNRNNFCVTLIEDCELHLMVTGCAIPNFCFTNQTIKSAGEQRINERGDLEMEMRTNVVFQLHLQLRT